MTVSLATVLLTLVLSLAGLVERAAPACRQMKITGYVRSEYGPLTYDETPIWTPEPIAAASWDVPLGHYVQVADLGLYRVADRGMLGSSGWIDVAVWDRATAYAITSVREVCVIAPEELGATAP